MTRRLTFCLLVFSHLLALAHVPDSLRSNVAWDGLGRAATNRFTVDLPQTIELRYDSNGNLTNDGKRIFAYDAENRLLTNWVSGEWKSEFLYDGLGRRRVARDYAWQNSQWQKTNEVRFIYDGFLLVQEQDEHNAVRATYTRGLDLSGGLDGAGGIGGLLAVTLPSGHFYYHSDASGNVTALLDSRGDLAARYLYNPFGRLTAAHGPMAGANPMGFSSMPSHRASGLSAYTFRDYDPALQRWLQRDPIGEAGGLNLYGFVGNRPSSQIDPHGLLGWGDFNPGLLWDPEVYQGLLSSAVGSGGGVPLDPNSNRSLLNDEGIAPGRLVDEEGNSYNGGQLVGVAAGTVAAIVVAEVVDQFSPLDEVGDLAKGGKKLCKKLPKRATQLPGPKFPAAEKALHGHHTYPKSIGGHPKQPLAELLDNSHIGKGGVHSDLARFEGGWLRPRKGTTGADIVNEFGQDAVEAGLRRFYSQDKWSHLLPTFEKAAQFTRQAGGH